MAITRQQYLASMTPTQAAANQGTSGYTPASQMNTITLTPQHEAQVQQAYQQGTSSVPQYALPNATGPIGQAAAGIEATRGAQGQQGYYAPAIPQQQPMNQSVQGNGSFFPQGGGMVDVPQERGMLAGAGQDLLNLIRNPAQIGQQMQTGQVSPGLAAVGLGIDLAMPGPGVAEAKIARAGSRALGVNPRNLAKLSPEIIAQIKKLTGVTAKLGNEGEILMQEGGEKILASMGKSTAGTATETAVNSKVKELVGSAIKKWGSRIFVGSLGLSTLYKYMSNQKSTQNDLTSYLDESAKTQTALRNTGNPEDSAAADALLQAGHQLEQDLTKWTSSVPIFGKGNQKIQEAERQVNAHNNRMAANKITADKTALQNQLDRDAKKSEADRKVLAGMVGKSDEEIANSSEIAEAANDNALIQRRYMEALQNIKNKRDEEEQRLYNEMQKELDRRYAEGQKAAQQAFTQSLPEDSGGSALNFGGGQW